MKYLIALLFQLSVLSLLGQEKVNLQVFGSLLYEFNSIPSDSLEPYTGGFEIQEQDFFVTANLHERWDFLGEFIIRPDQSMSGFSAGIMRARMKYKINENHSFLFGRMHSAVNYWNDVFYHGRVLFPTVDRPLNFKYYLPMHFIGARMQGQGIGKYNFGYDFSLGNRVVTTKIDDLSYVASIHLQPKNGVRWMIGYSNDHFHSNDGAHESHGMAISEHNHDYEGDIKLNQVYFSFARFRKNFEFLNEFSGVYSASDSLGASTSFSNYTYAGYRIKDQWIPYAMVDIMSIGERELYVRRSQTLKFALGCRYEYSPLVNFRLQLENYSGLPWQQSTESQEAKFEIKLQLSYAF